MSFDGTQSMFEQGLDPSSTISYQKAAFQTNSQ